jgi:hypothetical protein
MNDNVFLVVCLVMISLFVYIAYSYIESYSSFPSIDDGKSCSKYTNFMEQPVNIAYYQYPRFKNSREACENECAQGIWWGENQTGSLRCCKEACKNTKVSY